MMGQNVLLCPQGNVLLEKDRPLLTNGLKVRKKMNDGKKKRLLPQLCIHFHISFLAVGHIMNDAA